MTAVTTIPARNETGAWRATLPHLLPFLAVLAVALLLPLVGNDYWALIGTRMAIYWVLVSGLNLVVGFAGQLAIGYVALLTLGAYTTSVLVAGNVMPPLPVFAALAGRGCRRRGLRRHRRPAGAAAAHLLLRDVDARLRHHRDADRAGLAERDRRRHRHRRAGVSRALRHRLGLLLPLPRRSPPSRTWITANIARSRFGRALIALRDAEVAAEATGISKTRMLIAIFLLAGALAAVAGGLFATLQTYITPDAFTFDLSVLFFIAILIGGRGSILGPLLGTAILTVLPEIAAPLAAWSTFLYAVLLLVIVLVMPGGIAALLDFRNRRPLASNRAIVPRPAALADIMRGRAGGTGTGAARHRAELRRCARHRRARSRCRTGPDPWPDRPERQRQDHDAERHLRLLRCQGRRDDIGRAGAAARASRCRARPRHRAHLPDPARDRRGVGAGERHDRRQDRGQGQLHRGAALAAAQPLGRADADREGARAAWRSSGSERWRMCAPTGCSTANCASSRSPVR